MSDTKTKEEKAAERAAKKAAKAKGTPAAPTSPGSIRRYVAANRVAERESEGWKRVEGLKDSVLRGGAVLMEKAA